MYYKLKFLDEGSYFSIQKKKWMLKVLFHNAQRTVHFTLGHWACSFQNSLSSLGNIQEYALTWVPHKWPALALATFTG